MSRRGWWCCERAAFALSALMRRQGRQAGRQAVWLGFVADELALGLCPGHGSRGHREQVGSRGGSADVCGGGLGLVRDSDSDSDSVSVRVNEFALPCRIASPRLASPCITSHHMASHHMARHLVLAYLQHAAPTGPFVRLGRSLGHGRK